MRLALRMMLADNAGVTALLFLFRVGAHESHFPSLCVLVLPERGFAGAGAAVPWVSAGWRWRAEMRERREALREELRRQQSEPGRRDARREADGPALRRLNADEREQLRQQMREAARDGERPRRR